MTAFPLFLALKYLRPKRSFVSIVTLISVLGVLLGVAILVIVLSVMTGFDDMWREKILSFKPHLTVYGRYGALADVETLSARLDELPGIQGVSPAIESLVLVQHHGLTEAPVMLGLDPDRAGRVTRVAEQAFMKQGRFDLNGNQVVLGVDLARRLGARVGSTLLIHSPQNVTSQDSLYLPEEAEVAGIFDLGMRDFDSQFLLCSLSLARDLTGLDEGAHALYVMTSDPFRFGAFQQQVQGALGDGYVVRTWQEIDAMLFSALSHEKTIMFVLLVFITIVAIFCVTNTLIVITVQKTHEIGLLKALGFSAGKIMAAFVWLGWLQCLVGIAAGLGAGLLVLTHLNVIVDMLTSFDVQVFPKEIYGLSEIPWRTSPSELLRVGLFVMVFCTLSSLLPACRAARMDPVEALRKE